MEMNVSPAPSLSTSIFSADAAGKLEQAIKHMVTTFLDEGLVERTEVVSILEDIIQMLERQSKEGNTSNNEHLD